MKKRAITPKYVQHVKIYLACNFKVNLITRLEVIALFSSFFSYCHHLASVVRLLTTQIYFKIAGWVDFDMLNMFAV
jgi:hypothetical protein